MKMSSNISTIIKIIKKCARTGKIKPADLARIVFLTADEVHRVSKYNYKGKSNRKEFSEKTKKATLIKQRYRCNICKKKLLGLFDFDHINGSRSNNSPENCQALCLNCHAKKTRKNKKQNQASLQNYLKNYFQLPLAIRKIIFHILQ